MLYLQHINCRADSTTGETDGIAFLRRTDHYRAQQVGARKLIQGIKCASNRLRCLAWQVSTRFYPDKCHFDVICRIDQSFSHRRQHAVGIALLEPHIPEDGLKALRTLSRNGSGK